MSFKTILENIRYIIEFFSVLGLTIEVIPIQISPLRWIGNRLNSDVIERIEILEKKSLERDLQEKRSFILNFANTLRTGKKHSVEEYNHILELIDNYHGLCEMNHIKNGFIEVQSQYIIDTYMILSRDGRFKEKIRTGDLL